MAVLSEAVPLLVALLRPELDLQRRILVFTREKVNKKDISGVWR